MTENELQKCCPRCGETHDLTATVCTRCGRKFRTSVPTADVTLRMPIAPHTWQSAAPLPSSAAPALRLPAMPPVPPGSRLRLARPKPTLRSAVVPPEVRNQAALDGYAQQFLGLARFYALAVLTVPTVLMPLLLLTLLRATEARLCGEVTALGLDADVWSKPLRRARAARIVRAVGKALSMVLLFVVFVFVLHKGINYLDSKMDPIVPDSDGTGAPSSN